MSTLHGAALTAPHIFGIFDNANSAEITASGIAVEKAKSQAVKNFAARMIQDHRSLLHESRTLASQLGVTPQASSDSTLIKLQRQMLDTLRTAPSGASFDSLYMATQIRVHQHAIDVVRSATQAASDSQLRDLLKNALAMLESHLRDAQRIQQGLSA